ncbi:VCBS repeat-containing protein [Vibrio vulnificus]|nr:VCBS repeat-containing protein [Vibrio vulnificus]MCU8133734.1 FG-GAP-like repeat-containing protein [Vibrio vulnificus]
MDYKYNSVGVLLILATASFVSPYVSSSTFIDDSERRNTIGVENSGVASVGIDGNAKYYYSIPVPLGVNSFTPELGISYSSSAQNGDLGIGWSLSGVESITRCKGSYFVDGNNVAVTGQKSDKFCFNGMRLVNVEGQYGAAGTEYRTLSDTYKKIVLHRSMQESDSWFEVWDSNGVRSEFRPQHAPSGQAPLTWFLTKKNDLSGNSISYRYKKKPNEINSRVYLSEIDYSAFKIRLNYENSNKTRVDYIAGVKNVDNYRLTDISVFKDDETDPFLAVLADYDLNESQLDLLSKIRVARNGRSEIDAFRIDWSSAGTNKFIDYKRVLSGDFSSEKYAVREFADIDGNGIPDFVGFAKDGVYVAFGEVGGTYSVPQKLVRGYVEETGGWNVASHPRMLSDVNGDGKADIVGFANAGIYVSLSEGKTFKQGTFWSNAYGVSGGWSVQAHERMLADVNGDGFNDVVGFAHQGVYVSLSDGKTFSEPKLWISQFGNNQGWSNTYHIRTVADINGDGMADVVGFSHQGVNIALSTGNSFVDQGKDSLWLEGFGYSQGWTKEYHIRQVKDVNGDGLADIIGFSHSGVKVSLSTGIRLSGESLWSDHFGYAAGGWRLGDHPRTLSDVNGDSIPDIIGFANDRVLTSLNLETGFATREEGIRAYGTRAGSWVPGRDLRLSIDINADNKSDIIGAKEDGIYTAVSDFSSYKVVSITSSLGNQDSFEYGNLTDPDVYTVGQHTTYPQKDIVTGTVVKSISSSNGVGGKNEILYKYEGKRTHLMGAGNLGFQKVHLFDKTMNRVISTTYNQEVENTLLYTAIKEKFTCQFNSEVQFTFESCKEDSSNLIHSLANYWNTEKAIGNQAQGRYVSPSPAYKSPFEPRQRYKQQLVKQVEKSWDLHGSLLKTVTSERAYDKWYGNTLSEIISTQDHINGQWFSKSTKYKYKQPNTNNWLVGLLENKVTSFSGSELYSNSNSFFERTYDYEYDSKGNLIRKYEQKGTDLERSTVLSNFDRGLPRNVTEHWSGYLSKNILNKSSVQVNQKTTKFIYDKYGYVTQSINALGQKTLTQFDPIWGQVTRLTEIDGNTTTYHLDDWGREIGIDLPSGAWSRVKYAKSSDDYNSIYLKSVSSNVSPLLEYRFDSKHREVGTIKGIYKGYSYVFKKYNNKGEVIGSTIPSKLTSGADFINYTYDSLGRITEIVKPNGNVSSYRYYGFTTEFTNAERQTTSTIVNAIGQKIEVKDDANNSVNYYYDGWGNLTKTSDPKKNEIIVEYNELGQRTKLIDPDLGEIEYYSNGLDLVYKTVTNNKIIVTDFYDEIGRLIKKVDPDAPSGRHWIYNAKGQLEKAYQPGYFEGYKYYPNGLVMEKSFGVQSNSYSQKYTYDLRGRLSKLEYGNEIVTTYNYSQDNFLKEVYLSDRGVKEIGSKIWAIREIDAFGNNEEQYYGNELIVTKKYDDVTGYIKNIITKRNSLYQDSLLETNYDFDSIGNLVYREERKRDQINRVAYDFKTDLASYKRYDLVSSDKITYDNLNRITSISSNKISFVKRSWQENYLFKLEDPCKYKDCGFISNKNPNFYAEPNILEPFIGATKYEPYFNKLISVDNPVLVGYSNDGFPTADYSKSSILDVPIDPEPSSYNENYGVVTLDYDVLGNITHKSDVGSYRYDGVKPHAVSAVSGKTHSSFTYDAQGNMLSGLGRVITGYTSFNKPIEIRKGNASTRFQYGVNQQRYERIDRNENGVTQTIYLDSTEIIKQPNGQTTFRYYIGDFAIYEKTVGKASSSVIRYLHKDHLGSVIAISNQNGEIEERFSYDAWGKRRSSSWNKPDTSTSEVGRIGFTGHEMLDEVGLIHMNGRVYDPTIGRFLSADPFIQDEWFTTQAFNRYSYVQNNPLSYTDPTGYYVPKDTSESSTSSEQERNDYRQYERDRDRDRDRNEVASTQAEVGYGNHSDFIAGYNQPRDPEAAAEAASMLLGGGSVAIGAKLARPFLGRAFGWASSKIKKALGFGDEAADVAKNAKVHKNSLDYVGDTHVYRVKGPDGSTYKIGESAQGTRLRDGASIRAEQQARRLTRETGDTYTSEIRKTFSDKASARAYETRVIERFRRMYGQDTLQGNKTNR